MVVHDNIPNFILHNAQLLQNYCTTIDIVEHRKPAFEIFDLLAHHGKVKLNVVLVTTDDSQEVKFELVQHLNVENKQQQEH